MGVIFSASTGIGSSNHTSRFIVPFLKWIAPNLSEPAIEDIHFYVRKTAHLTEYAILAILFWRAQRGEPKFSGASLRRQFLNAVLFSAIYAATDEFHQSFNSAREARVRDVVIDTAGATCGSLVFLGFVRWRQKPK